MERFRWFRRFFMLLIVVTNGMPVPLGSQSSDLRLIYDGAVAIGVSWSGDSRYLVFASAARVSLDTSGDLWVRYDTQTGAIDRFNRWPLQPQFTAAETQVFKPAATPEKQAFVYLSPDKRFIVYAGEPVTGEGVAWQVMLGDRQSKQVIATGGTVGQPFIGPDGFKIVWNSASTAFTIEQAPYSGEVIRLAQGYVTGFTPVLSRLTIQRAIQKPTIHSQSYWGQDIFAISRDGKIVLISASPDSPDDKPDQLVLYNASSPNTSEIIMAIDRQNVFSANFAPGNEALLVAVNGTTGLVLYDRTNRVIQILDATINASWVGSAYFSPDGKWLVLQHKQTGQLYLFNVADKLLTVTRPS